MTVIKNEFVNKLFRLLRKFESCDELRWYFEGDQITFYVTCSDQFYWACADAEDITSKTLPILEQSFKDCEKAGFHLKHYGTSLYCCRMRKMRPQGAAYPPEALWSLFDACGPERKIDFGNPHKKETKRYICRPSLRTSLKRFWFRLKRYLVN